MRAFTSVSEEGTAKKGSLRHARCVNKGLIFHGSIRCCIADTKEVKDALRFVKWIGTMRNRGFGNVRIEEEPYPKEEKLDTQTII
jgi:CRISPR-associated protein Csx10